MPRQAKPRWNEGRSRWYANVGDPGPDGRRREVFAPATIGEKDEAAAWEWFRAEVGRRQEEVVESDPRDVGVEWIVEHYLAWAERRRDEGKLSGAHYKNKEHHLGIFLDHGLGGRVARTLTPEDMDGFVDALQALYSPNYVANICSTVSAAFNWAVPKHLEVNPIRGFEVPVVPRSPERYAERAEAAVFLRHWLRRNDRRTTAGRFDRQSLLLVRVLIRTGARPGELCDLWWDDLRWAAGTSSAGHAYAKATIPAERHKTGEKTGKPRTIYLTPVLTRAVLRLRDRPLRHPRHVFTHGRGRGGKGAGQPWESGSRLSQKILRVRRELIAAQEEIRRRIERGEAVSAAERRKAAVKILDEGHNRLTNYRWRHTAISTLLMMGVDVPTVAELTGTSPEMIYRIYGHLLDSHLGAAAEKLAGKGRARA